MEKDSRAKLIEAATVLFAEKGFAEVSIRELSKAAQVNSALIAYYFGGKDGLYQAVVEEYLQQIEERMTKIVTLDLDPLDKLTGFINNLAVIHREMPYLRKFLSRELINPTPAIEHAIKKYIGRFYQMVLGILTEAVDEGVVRNDLILNLVPITVAGMIHFYFLAEPVINRMAFLVPGLDDEEAVIHQMKDIFLKGILRKPDGAPDSEDQNI